MTRLKTRPTTLLSVPGAAIGLGPMGADAIAFFVILACCVWALVRTWRAEHAYG